LEQGRRLAKAGPANSSEFSSLSVNTDYDNHNCVFYVMKFYGHADGDGVRCGIWSELS